MPKRSHKTEDSEFLRWKIKKLEKKLAKSHKVKRNRDCSESSNSSLEVVPALSDQEDVTEIQPHMELAIDEVQPSTGAGTSSDEIISTIVEADIPVIDGSADLGLVPPELDEDILNLLGETPSKDKKYGPEIRNELSVRWEHIATSGLTKDVRRELLDKHLVPKNCIKIDAPKLNPETKAALSDLLIKKDKALENKQIQIASCISCISAALNHLFSCENKNQTLIRLMIDAGRLLCDTQHTESMTRRSFICSALKKDIKDHLYNTEIDTFLFGEKLSDTLKTAKAISKSGAEIKIPAPPKKTIQKPKPSIQALNQKPPLPSTRQAGAARRYEPTATKPSRLQQQSRQPPRSQLHPPQRR